MQSLKRDLAIGLSASAVIFVCALAWGSPFVATSSGAKSAQVQAQPQQGQTGSKIFAGTVVKTGEEYALRESSGQVYKLDNSESVKAYEGKPAKVTGKLDEEALLIHVESIEGTES